MGRTDVCASTNIVTVVAATTPTKATRRDWLGLAVIALPCMLYSMDLTVLNLAVPSMAAHLNPSASQLLWIIDIYGFMVAGFLMVMGALGDRFGRRKVLLIGAALFGIMSIIAAFAQTAEQLIVARAMLGVAGATLAPSTLSLISNMFRDEHERTFAISMWIASFSAGAILGPLVGGLLLQYFWWGSVFLIAVPTMLLLLALGPFLLPEFRIDDPPRLDFTSALLSLIAVLIFIFGVKHAAEYGIGGLSFLAITLGLLIAGVFIYRQSRLADAMLDLTLFKSGAFTLSLIINLLALFFMFGSFIFMAQYLQLVAGLTPLEAGLWSLPGAIAFTLVSFMNARLAARFSSLQIFVGGLLLSAFGFAMLLFSSGLYTVVVAMTVASVGFTPLIALTTAYVVGAVPPEKAGVASALTETAGELGGALGIALLGSLATLLYRNRMTGIVPADLDPTVTAALKSSLAVATETAKSLPADVGEPLLVAARAAFMTSYHATAILAAIALISLALLASRVLASKTSAGH
jgi:MFS transporter, DHA2 family, multidrug resistance protein